MDHSTGTVLPTFSGTILFHHKHETPRRESDATFGSPEALLSSAGQSRGIKKLEAREGSREEMNEGERQTSRISYMSNINCDAV